VRIVRVDGVPAGEDAVGAATAIKDASLDGGKRAGDIFKGFCADECPSCDSPIKEKDSDLKAIMAAFCAPLPAPLPMVALVAYLIRIEETRLHSYDCSASRGDEGNSQRQFAC